MREKRAQNRKDSPKLLTSNGIEYTTNNGGIHIMIQVKRGRVDFWPGTGLWMGPGKKGRGVKGLIEYVLNERKESK